MTPSTRRNPEPNIDKPYDFSKQVGHLLRRAYQRHTAVFQEIIPNDQLTAAQLVSLCAIKDSGTCSLSHIVKQTAIDQATIRGVISRLKARGLVTTQHDGLDKRRVLVQLTAKGANLVQAMVPYAFEVTEHTFSGLNSAERVALLYLLTKMCQADDMGFDQPPD